jgi:hypothetical protein
MFAAAALGVEVWLAAGVETGTEADVRADGVLLTIRVVETVMLEAALLVVGTVLGLIIVEL